jgi:hypothetical protein
MVDDAAELKALRASLNQPPAELPLESLFPIFVPASFFSLGNWPGPYEITGLPELGLTWSVLQPKQTMRYVDRDVQAYWEAQGLPWRERAVANLAGGDSWTHEFRRDGGQLYAVAMMHPDGAGPSRLLLREQLETVFPEGYLVALPEMSCGLALSAEASSAERDKIAGIVERCFSGARPLVRGMHEP